MTTEGLLTSVQRIVDVYLADNGLQYFRINWKDTWEPELHLISCEELLEKFWKKKRETVELKCEIKDPSLTKRQDKSESTTSEILCNCGKPFNTDSVKSNADSVKKTFVEKSTQYSASASEFGVQVNSSYRKNCNVSDSRSVDTSEVGTQINMHHKKSCTNVGVQFGCGIGDTSELGTQVNMYKCKQRNMSMQFSPKTVECGIQYIGSYRNQYSQFENILTKESSTQSTPTVEKVKMNEVQCSQFENEFLDEDTGAISQKETSTQFSPQTVDMGIQNTVHVQDHFTQCENNTFVREVSCQQTPKTTSCGTQKNMNVNKHSQYKSDFVTASSDFVTANISLIDDIQLSAVTSGLNEESGNTQLYAVNTSTNGVSLSANTIASTNETSLPATHLLTCTTSTNEETVVTQLYAVTTSTSNDIQLDSPVSSDVLPEEDTQPYAEDINQIYQNLNETNGECGNKLQNEHLPCNSHDNKLQNEHLPCNSHDNKLQNELSQPCTQFNGEDITRNQTVQADKYSHLIEDQDLNFNATVEEEPLEHGEGRMKEMLFVADIPFVIEQQGDNVTDKLQNNKHIVSASVTTGEIAVYNQPTTITSLPQSSNVTTLSQDIVFHPQAPANVTSQHDNSTSSVDQAILDSSSNHFIFQSQEDASGQIQQLVSLPKELIMKLSSDNSHAQQILYKNIASIGEELTSLIQPTVYSDVKRGSSSGRQTSKTSRQSGDVLKSSDVLKSPDGLKSPDSLKSPAGLKKKKNGKRKRGSVTEISRYNNQSDGKRKVRTKKNQDILVVNNQSNDNSTFADRDEKLVASPVYDVSPCTSGVYDVSPCTSGRTSNENTVNSDISNFSCTSKKSDGKNINDVFISKYWK